MTNNIFDENGNTPVPTTDTGVTLDAFKEAAGIKGTSKFTSVSQEVEKKNIFDEAPDNSPAFEPGWKKSASLLWGSESKYNLRPDWQREVSPQKTNFPTLDEDTLPPELSAHFTSALQQNIAKSDAVYAEKLLKWQTDNQIVDFETGTMKDTPEAKRQIRISTLRNKLVDADNATEKNSIVQELISLDKDQAAQIIKDFGTQEAQVNMVEAIPVFIAAGYAAESTGLNAMLAKQFKDAPKWATDLASRTIASGAIFGSIGAVEGGTTEANRENTSAGAVAIETLKGAGKGVAFGAGLSLLHKQPVKVLAAFTGLNMLPQKDEDGNEVPGLTIDKALPLAAMQLIMFGSLGMDVNKAYLNAKDKWTSFKNRNVTDLDLYVGDPTLPVEGRTVLVGGKMVPVETFKKSASLKEQFRKENLVQTPDEQLGKVFGAKEVTDLNTPTPAPEVTVEPPLSTTLNVRPAEIRKVQESARDSITMRQKAYLETLSNTDLKRMVSELAQGGMFQENEIFNPNTKLGEVIDERGKMIDTLLTYDKDFVERRLDSIRTRIVTDPTLTYREKLATLWSEESGVSTQDIQLLFSIQEPVYKKDVLDGNFTGTFDEWWEKRISLEAEKANVPLFQAEESIPATSVHPSKLPMEIRKGIFDIAYERDSATDASVEAARSEEYKRDYDFLYSQLVPGRSKAEIFEAISTNTTLTERQKQDARSLFTKLLAYSKTGAYIKPEDYASRSVLLREVGDGELIPSFKQAVGDVGLAPKGRAVSSMVEFPTEQKAFNALAKQMGYEYDVSLQDKEDVRNVLDSFLDGEDLKWEKDTPKPTLSLEERRIILKTRNELYKRIVREDAMTQEEREYLLKAFTRSMAQTGVRYVSGSSTVNALIQFAKNKSAYIKLFKTGNFTSVAHELAHPLIFNFTPKQVETLAKIVATHTNGDIKEVQKMQRAMNMFITNPQHPSLVKLGEYIPALEKPMEYLARSWEQYLHTGKAPMYELVEPFKEVSKLMKETYKTLKDIPNLTDQLDPAISSLFDELLGGPQFSKGETIPVTIEGKVYLTYVSKVRKGKHDDIQASLAKKKAKIMLRKIEQGGAELAGMVDEVRQYAEDMWGKDILVQTKKGVVAKPNPLFKDKAYLLKLETMRTVDDAYKTVALINRMQFEKDAAEKQEVIIQINELRANIDWKRIDPFYKEKLLDLFEGIDFKKLSDKKLKELSSLRAVMERDIADNNVRDSLLNLPLSKMKELTRLSEKNVYDMSLEDLNTLLDAVKTLAQLHALKGQILLKNTFDFLEKANATAAAELSRWKEDPTLSSTGTGIDYRTRRFLAGLAEKGKTQTKSLELLCEVIGGIELKDDLTPAFPIYPKSELGKVARSIIEGSSAAREIEQATADFAQQLAREVDLTSYSKMLKTIGHLSSFPTWGGKKDSYEMVPVSMEVYNPETGNKSTVRTDVLIKKGELKTAQPQVGSIYKVTVDGKTVGISKQLYESLLEPEKRLTETDYVFVELMNEGNRILHPITKSQRMLIYNYTKNKYATESMLKGGFRFREKDTVEYHITSEALRKLRSEITEDEKYVAARMMHFMEDYIKPRANAVSKNVVFFNIMDEVNYFPLHKYAPNRGQTEVLNKPALGAELAAFSRKYLERSGILQTRSGVEAPIFLEDAFEVFSSYGREAGRYIGLTVPLRYAKAVITIGEDKPNSFISQLKRTKEWGEGTANALKKLIDRVEDLSVHSTDIDNLIRLAYNRAVESVLNANFSVFFMQRFTDVMCLDYGVSNKNLAIARARGAITPKFTIAELSAMHSDLRHRYETGVTPDQQDIRQVSNTKQDWIIHEPFYKQLSQVHSWEEFKMAANEGFRGKTLGWLYYGDAQAASIMIHATELQMAEDYPHLSKKEQHKKAIELFRMIMRRTQSTNLRESLNLIGSTPSAAEKLLVGALQNQSHMLAQERWYHTQILKEQLRRLKDKQEQGKKDDAGKSRTERRSNEKEREKEAARKKTKFIIDLLKIFARIDLTMSFKISLWRQMLYELGEDPDKKNKVGFIERTIFGVLNNTISTRPIYGPYAASVVDVWSKGKYNSFEINNLVTSSINNITEQYGDALNKLGEGELLKAGAAALKGTGYAVSLAVGYPVMQLVKDIRYVTMPIKKMIRSAQGE